MMDISDNTLHMLTKLHYTGQRVAIHHSKTCELSKLIQRGQIKTSNTVQEKFLLTKDKILI